MTIDFLGVIVLVMSHITEKNETLIYISIREYSTESCRQACEDLRLKVVLTAHDEGENERKRTARVDESHGVLIDEISNDEGGSSSAGS